MHIEQTAGQNSSDGALFHSKIAQVSDNQIDDSSFQLILFTPLKSKFLSKTEHERYITEQIVGGPTFILNYPKDIKAFYMRQNDDGRTVAAMDLLVPKVGEIIGGSQREERLDRLELRMAEMGLPKSRSGGIWTAAVGGVVRMPVSGSASSGWSCISPGWKTFAMSSRSRARRVIVSSDKFYA
jgi:hypothetical protein